MSQDDWRHNMQSDPFKQLRMYSEQYGLQISDEDLYKTLKHTELVLEKNKVINLTSIKEMDRAVILHTLDSLLFLKILTSCEGFSASKKKVLDLGTGGGYPGLPIACCSLCKVTLLDSVGKKIAACQEFVQELNLEEQVTCIHARFEEYALNHKQEFDFVVARAVAPLDILIEYAEPYVSIGGTLVFGKANPDNNELMNAQRVAKLCGFKNVSRETFELPENFGHRELFVYKKTKASSVKLPRRNGEAKNKPLASK